MFTILHKSFNGSCYDRYFKSWDKAKETLLSEVAGSIKELNGSVTKSLDYFNADKGLYIFVQEVTFDNGITCKWALIDGYFEDEDKNKTIQKL